jgi:hypothetical protein
LLDQGTLPAEKAPAKTGLSRSALLVRVVVFLRKARLVVIKTGLMKGAKGVKQRSRLSSRRYFSPDGDLANICTVTTF